MFHNRIHKTFMSFFISLIFFSKIIIISLLFSLRFIYLHFHHFFSTDFHTCYYNLTNIIRCLRFFFLFVWRNKTSSFTCYDDNILDDDEIWVQHWEKIYINILQKQNSSMCETNWKKPQKLCVTFLLNIYSFTNYIRLVWVSNSSSSHHCYCYISCLLHHHTHHPFPKLILIYIFFIIHFLIVCRLLLLPKPYYFFFLLILCFLFLHNFIYPTL